MSKIEFRRYVRRTLRTATKSSDEIARLAAVRELAAMVLAQEYAGK